MASNTTLIDFRQSPDYRGYRVIGLNSALVTVTTIIVGCRYYVRFFMSKNAGIDDFITGLAYVSSLILSYLILADERSVV